MSGASESRRRAAVIGGGVIGGGWAARFLLNGWDVDFYDPAPQAEAAAKAMVAQARRSLPALYDRLLPPEGALRVAASAAEAAGAADWIQESVPERLDLKRRVLAEIAEASRPEAVIGSSTSGFKPSELQAELAPEAAAKVLVLHPFNPVYLLPLLEVAAAPTTAPETVDRAEAWALSIGMAPLRVRQEIDAHIADRLLEAVWRESLWLVKDGVATTGEIDDAIRLGFGLRWAQMGLFETYRIAGGEAGMRHFLAQFGPALQWPWTKLTDVPDLDDTLIETIAAQSDAQSGHMGLRELERQRDDNLVGILRALKHTGAGAGATLAAHEATLGDETKANPAPELAAVEGAEALTLRRTAPQTWADPAGRIREAGLAEAFAQASDRLLGALGAGPTAPQGYDAVESRIQRHGPASAGERITVVTEVAPRLGRTLRLRHRLNGEDGRPIATAVQAFQHMNRATDAPSPPKAALTARLRALAAASPAGAAPAAPAAL